MNKYTQRRGDFFREFLLVVLIFIWLGSINEVLAAKYTNDNVWMRAGAYQGVEVFWRFRQELSDQFIAELKFENHNPYKVEVSFKSVFMCPHSSSEVKEKVGSEITINAGASVGGQWAGLFYYPCTGVPPSRGGFSDMTVKRIN